MPTRLLVLLQRRKSAAAGSACAPTASISTAPAARPRPNPGRRRCGGRKSWILGGLSIACLVPHGARISREPSWPVNEDGPEVVDICEGRPRRQQVPQLGKESGRIVVGKKDGRIEAEAAGAREARLVDERTGRILGLAATAVGAIGIGGKG